jgi:hypothetical protein
MTTLMTLIIQINAVKKQYIIVMAGLTRHLLSNIVVLSQVTDLRQRDIITD